MMRKASLIFLLTIAAVILVAPIASQAQIAVGVSIRVAPPALPVYVQPPVPGPGYIWTPGYWAYGPDGYYWVPGTWVEPPTVGLLWTPGYWGWRGGLYVWNGGYWGPHVGFYGGINYGFGYGGVGFVGGEWRGGVFNYNRSVTNVNTTIIHNTYNTTVINNNTTINNHTSFNGGTGGVQARPTAGEQSAMHEHHVEATAAQTQHHEAAGKNRAMLASVNHGSPSVAASPKAGVFSGQGVSAARNANVNRAANNNSPAFKGNNNAQTSKGGNGSPGGNNNAMRNNANNANAYKGGNANNNANAYKGNNANNNMNRGNYNNNARASNNNVHSQPHNNNGGGGQKGGGNSQPKEGKHH